MEPAPWPRRTLAWCVDVTLALAVGVAACACAAGTGWLGGLARLLTLKTVDTALLGPLSPATLARARAGDPAALALVGRAALALTAVLGAWILYKVVCVHRWGRTLGKRLAGLAVQPVDAAGAPTPGRPSWGQAWRRTGVPVSLSAVPVPGLGFVAYLAAWRHPARRGLHDRAAGTVVVRVRPADRPGT